MVGSVPLHAVLMAGVDVRIDGLAWWTPWFWTATYGAPAVVYVTLWRKGWLARATMSNARDCNHGVAAN
jgi:hypothetical protein